MAAFIIRRLIMLPFVLLWVPLLDQQCHLWLHLHLLPLVVQL